VDAPLPEIQLDRYGIFIPTNNAIRRASEIQHLLGWWLVTLFFGASSF
jgi:hypothetical protein